MRLTRLLTDKEIKLANDYSISEETKHKKGDFTICNNVSPFELENKLGQLEDIEDELGADLLTLFYKNTIVYFIEWGKHNKKTILETDTFTINPKTKNIVAFVENREPVILTPNLYKKGYCYRGWAFTREELER